LDDDVSCDDGGAELISLDAAVAAAELIMPDGLKVAAE